MDYFYNIFCNKNSMTKSKLRRKWCQIDIYYFLTRIYIYWHLFIKNRKNNSKRDIILYISGSLIFFFFSFMVLFFMYLFWCFLGSWFYSFLFLFHGFIFVFFRLIYLFWCFFRFMVLFLWLIVQMLPGSRSVKMFSGEYRI